jgi:calcium-translocating P-type ATPase
MDMEWHSLPLIELTHRLASSTEGLSSAYVDTVRRRVGPNLLPQPNQRSFLAVAGSQLNSPLIYLLLVAAVVSALTGEFADAAFVFIVLLINTALGTWQEFRAESSAKALRDTTRSTALVRRDGMQMRVDSSELVPGDFVLTEAGDRVPADIRLVTSSGLRLDESLLTGESDFSDKVTIDDLPSQTPLVDRINCLFAGTTVRAGRGEGIVFATGSQTAVGGIAKELNQPQPDPPVMQRLRAFARLLGFVTLGIVVIFVAARLAMGGGLHETVLVGVALAISVIPEGLPVAITVAFAVASRRMAARNVIVRKLPAVEGLGACTVIATDKTGTLTVNQLTAREIWLPTHGFVHVSGEGLSIDGHFRHADDVDAEAAAHAVRRLTRTATLTNDATFSSASATATGDAVDVALLVLAAKATIEHAELRGNAPRVVDLPFDPERRYSASLNLHDDGHRLHVKGAPEVLLPFCDGGSPREIATAAVEQMAAQGYRVVALARRSVAEHVDRPLEAHLHDMQFLGLVGFIDPLRPEAAAAVAACHSAGVVVKMITGDHATTALSIARQLGIAADASQVVLGKDVAQAGDDPDRLATLAEANVFARVEPTHKAGIVRALRNAGHFVAMTGDGVNDAPALQQADIGIAMGSSGTDVAREAADLVLLDDNFASIVAGIEEGRAAYDNIRKVIYLLVATGLAEAVIFVLAMLFGLPLPLGAVQLLWLNLITNGGQDVALAFEAPEGGILSRPPRPPLQPLFDRQMLAQVLVSGTYMGIVSFAAFAVALQLGASEGEARNIVLFLLVMFENVHVFNARSEGRSALAVPLQRNWYLLVAVFAAQAVQFAAPYIPGLNGVLGIEPLPLATWLALAAVAVTILPLMEVFKVVRSLFDVRQNLRSPTS